MWITESNREDHAFYGTVVFAIIAVFNMLLWPIEVAAMASMEAVVGVALAMEFKDLKWGGKFDWLDVAATVLLPALLTFLIWANKML